MQYCFEKKLFDFIIFSNIYVALCVAGLVIETLILIGSLDFSFPLFVFFSTLFLYNLHRILRLRSMDQNKVLDLRYNWIRTNMSSFYMVFGISVVGLIYSLVQLNLKTILYLIPFALIAFGYSIPFIKRQKGFIALRDVPVLKTFFIVFVVSCITVLIPVIAVKDVDAFFQSDVLFMFGRRVLFVFAIAICFDIRDIQHDKENNLRTIPGILGIKRSKDLSFLALILFCLMVLAQLTTVKNISMLYAIALLISALIAAVIVNRISENKEEYFYSFKVEGTLLLQCFLVTAAHILFNGV